jgi:hypothetical protein
VEAGRLDLAATSAPNGGICFTGPVGAGCITQFPADGIAFTTGVDTDGPITAQARQVIAGIAADTIATISARSNAGSAPVTLTNGGSSMSPQSPAHGVGQLAITYRDGTTATVGISDPNAK